MMTLAFWCVVVAGVLPLVGTGVAKWGFKAFDNHNPRKWLSEQTGARARAVAAEQNTHESFPFFAAAVVMAHLTVGPHSLIDTLALVYLTARILFLVAYIKDWASFRTFVWSIAYICTLTIASAGAWLSTI